MFILYFAVHEINKNWGAEHFVNNGFIELGHTTHCIDYRKNADSIHKLYDKSPETDVLFLQRGEGFPIDILENYKKPKLFWASEMVSRCRDQDRLLERHDLFNHIFFHTKDCVARANKTWGIPPDKCSVLLNGFGKEVYNKIPFSKDIDILYSGMQTGRRVAILNQISRYFKVHISKAFGTELNDEMNGSKIILNIHASDFLDTETRVFETLGSGSFLLTEKLSEDNPFKNMVHLVEFENLQELVWRISYYLTCEEERAFIAKNGYDVAQNSHTYLNRALEISNIMEELI